MLVANIILQRGGKNSSYERCARVSANLTVSIIYIKRIALMTINYRGSEKVIFGTIVDMASTQYRD